MKLSTARIAVLSLIVLDYSFAEQVSVCNYDAIQAAFQGQDIQTILGVASEDEARNLISTACQKAINTQICKCYQRSYYKHQCTVNLIKTQNCSVPFKKITAEGWQFDNNYFDGGTYLNEEYEPKEVNFDEIYDGATGPAKTKIISYPDDYIEKNFGSCAAKSVVCCWVQDRYDDGNNNGNCDANDPETNCRDADPADNTDICGVDLSLAPGSNHVSGTDSTTGAKSFALFSGDSEGAAHCHGFAWNDEDSVGYRYRGNNLFYVSMYDHLEQRGYVREVPGAPMCGCVDKMPVISRSDCTQTDVEETYTVTLGTNSVLISLDTINVTFNACQGANNNNNDLAAYVDTLNFDDATQAVFDSFVVGECNDNQFLSKFGYAVSR